MIAANRQQYLLSVIQSFVLSEKSQRAQEKNQSLVLRVNTAANKLDIKDAVEMVFEVKVDTVNTLTVHGKTKRSKYRMTMRQDWKKAYVRLKSAEDLDKILNSAQAAE